MVKARRKDASETLSMLTTVATYIILSMLRTVAMVGLLTLVVAAAWLDAATRQLQLVVSRSSLYNVDHWSGTFVSNLRSGGRRTGRALGWRDVVLVAGLYVQAHNFVWLFEQIIIRNVAKYLPDPLIQVLSFVVELGIFCGKCRG
jgi:hypothetical protein